MTYRRNPLSRQGFTLIEMLIVLAIILVLGAIAFTGFQALLRGAAARESKMALTNASSILAEYDTATSFKSQPAAMWLPQPVPTTPPVKHIAAGFDIWKDADPIKPNPEGQALATAPVGDLEPNEKNTHLQSQAVVNTAVVLGVAGRMPGAKKILSGLPADATVQVNEPPPSLPNTPIAKILLDGWGNPIIFVPAAGLAGVMQGDPAGTYIIRSNKAYPYASTAERDTIEATLPPSARPFFASAGPDGDFSKGDDNIYSFQN